MLTTIRPMRPKDLPSHKWSYRTTRGPQGKKRTERPNCNIITDRQGSVGTLLTVQVTGQLPLHKAPILPT
jgi:hypothetical protein